MTENEEKKCPKCGGEMEEGERFLFPFFLIADETVIRPSFSPVKTVVILSSIKK